MKNLFIIVLSIFIFCVKSQAQGELKDYKEAEKWLWCNIPDHIYYDKISPNWIDNDSKIWYEAKTRKGQEFFLVDIKKKSKKELFNKAKLISSLNKYFKTKEYNQKLKLNKVYYKNDTLFFSIKKNRLKISLKDYTLSEITKNKNRLKSHEKKSPDGKFIAYIKEYNLFIKNLKTGKSKQLTHDGNKELSYGTSISWYYVHNENANKPIKYSIDATWSPDSKYLICAKYNRKHTKKLYMYKTSPQKGHRAQVYSYERPIAGDSLITQICYSSFNIETGKQINCKLKPIASFLNYGFKWKNNTTAYSLRYSRGYKNRELVELDVITGKYRVIIKESAKTYVDPNMHVYYVSKKNNFVIWSSEKDNWHQLYLYDYTTGKLKNKITTGNYVVREICKVDEKNKKIYFRANGKEKGDPYFTYLYSVGFNGKRLKLLGNENAYHICKISPKNKYIFDNYSRVDLPNKFVIRNSKTGKIVYKIAETDIEDLKNMGWQAPKTFEILGRDNKTKIYGNIFFPFNLDTSKKYPVIDGTYSGPQTIRSAKTFNRGIINMDIPISQLGFVVMTIDGLGSAFRSKTFHDVSYKNLGDIGALDHIKAIKEMAKKYPFMDIANVGIYGHSAGGYDSTHALLIHPEFYKVAVSSAGNHDHRSAKAWWPELYMGYPADKHYDEQSNYFLADKLKGKLLLAHGNMDNNVNPTASMRMADHLIKANKDFELLLIPDKDHGGIYYDKYFIRKRWDFFVKHLLHKNPPKQYKIK